MPGMAGTIAILLSASIVRAGVAHAQVELQHVRGDGRDIRMTKIADGISRRLSSSTYLLLCD
ncbi:MAG: hypothetical protein M3Y30_10530 [Gemmatimonadota bacterium]|nr:hypothetical protein [Gemmatimonadota bacterium]